MARLPVQSASGLARRLFHSSSSKEALQRIANSSESSVSCISCVLWPLASPLFGHPVAGWAGAAGHAYHRGGGSATDDEQNNPNSSSSRSSKDKRRGTSRSSREGSQDQGRTAQLRDLQQSLRHDPQSGGPEHSSDRHEALQLPEHVARIAMRDPLGVLISSLGVPLGISLKVNPSQVLQQHTEDGRAATRDELDWQQLVSAAAEHVDAEEDEPSSSTEASAADMEEPSTSVPDTDMQRLRQELHVKTKRFARRLQQQAATGSGNGAESEQAAAAAAAAAADSSSGSGGGPSALHQQLDSIRAMLRANADRWGTTQQSPAEIAQHIADSNRAAGGGGGDGSGGDGGDGGEEGDNEDDAPLTLSPAEERYADPSAVAAELKEMDEIFEVLAKVPWLDDEDTDERELRGLAAVRLLGTLEEVGWTIRDKLLALWAGERDVEVLTAGLGPREAAAVSSILYHTEQLEEQYGKPPKESVEAALAAANSAFGGGAAAGGEQGGEQQH